MHHLPLHIYIASWWRLFQWGTSTCARLMSVLWALYEEKEFNSFVRMIKYLYEGTQGSSSMGGASPSRTLATEHIDSEIVVRLYPPFKNKTHTYVSCHYWATHLQSNYHPSISNSSEHACHVSIALRSDLVATLQCIRIVKMRWVRERKNERVELAIGSSLPESNPEETRTSWGLYSLAIGSITWWNADK